MKQIKRKYIVKLNGESIPDVATLCQLIYIKRSTMSMKLFRAKHVINEVINGYQVSIMPFVEKNKTN